MTHISDVLDFLAVMLVDHVWQLCFLLPALLILKQIKDDVRPIFVAMLGPLTRQAQTNASAWAVGMMLGTLASLGALTDVAIQNHWDILAGACKVVGPGFATIVALIKQAQGVGSAPANPSAHSGATQPPFPPAAQP